jgi:ABC-type polysaccharide/polyol phosphate transport system ATPase subunit
MAFISLKNLELTFRVRQERRVALKEYILRGLFLKGNNILTEIKALRGVTLDVQEGDRLGIVGHNGSGKSTLLKVIAGIYPPTGGECSVEGKISSLFDFTLGFEPLASGRDNIFYRGYLQGETPESIREKEEEIAEFSELKEFLESPVRCYSAGMIVRLGFAIATAIEPEILIVDECLSAGDIAFQEKARKRMESMIEKANLIVMVSHDLVALSEFCNRIVWMEQGTVRMDGSPDIVLEAYRKAMLGEPEATPPVVEAETLRLAS